MAAYFYLAVDAVFETDNTIKIEDKSTGNQVNSFYNITCSINSKCHIILVRRRAPQANRRSQNFYSVLN